MSELASLDPDDWQREGTRPTWIRRVGGDCVRFIVEAMGEVKHEMRTAQVRRPLGLVFVKARAAARAAGRTLRSVFF